MFAKKIYKTKFQDNPMFKDEIGKKNYKKKV
jgi:hypothetical protein